MYWLPFILTGLLFPPTSRVFLDGTIVLCGRWLEISRSVSLSWVAAVSLSWHASFLFWFLLLPVLASLLLSGRG
jgi:hypothetical protein